MTHFWCQPGDVLFYFDAPNIETYLIQVGEDIEEHDKGPWPYHVAIALGMYTKLEAQGRETEINPIDYQNCVVCRPEYPSQQELNNALGWGRKQVGKLYGWFGIFDQILRDATRGHLHLPRWMVKWANKHWPYCSTLAQAVLSQAGITGIASWPPPSPADCWKPLRDKAIWAEGFEINKQIGG